MSDATSPTGRMPRDAAVNVRGSRMAYRQWGDDSEYPVLALHGWLDNAASFDALAPLLEGYRIIAPDLPGHGLSGHRAASGTYNIWDDLPDLVVFAERLRLERYALLGHSRGAFISVQTAAIEQVRVSSIVLLDGMMPPPFNEDDTVKQLREFAHDYGRRVTAGPRVFATVEEAIDARVRATGIDRRAAAMLVPRSLESVEGGCRWRTDGRLRYASSIKFGLAHGQALMRSLELPGLLMLAESDIGRRIGASQLIKDFAGLHVEQVEGCHHCHMLDQAPYLAERILDFWRGCERAAL